MTGIPKGSTACNIVLCLVSECLSSLQGMKRHCPAAVKGLVPVASLLVGHLVRSQASEAGPLLLLILQRALYSLRSWLSGITNGSERWPSFHSVGPRRTYLGPFIQEGIPDSQEDVTDERVSKDHEEPVESDEREVYTVLPQVCS